MDQLTVEAKHALSTIDIEKVGPHLGAEIHGVDASRPLDAATVRAIYQALLDHQVIIFRDQDISIEQQIMFGKSFGELSVHPFAPNVSETPGSDRA